MPGQSRDEYYQENPSEYQEAIDPDDGGSGGGGADDGGGAGAGLDRIERRREIAEEEGTRETSGSDTDGGSGGSDNGGSGGAGAGFDRIQSRREIAEEQGTRETSGSGSDGGSGSDSGGSGGMGEGWDRIQRRREIAEEQGPAPTPSSSDQRRQSGQTPRDRRTEGTVAEGVPDRVANQLRSQVASENEGIEANEVDVRVEDGQTVAEPTEGAVRQTVAEQTAREVTLVERLGGTARVEGTSRFQGGEETPAEAAAETDASRLEEVDEWLTPEEIVVSPADGAAPGASAGAAGDASGDTGAISTGQEQQYEAELTQDAEDRVVRQRVAERTGVATEDVEVVREGGDTRVQLAESAAQSMSPSEREQFVTALGGPQAGGEGAAAEADGTSDAVSRRADAVERPASADAPPTQRTSVNPQEDAGSFRDLPGPLEFTEQTFRAGAETYARGIDEEAVGGVQDRRVIPASVEERAVDAGEFVGDRIERGAGTVADRIDVGEGVDPGDAPGGVVGETAARVGAGTSDVTARAVRGAGDAGSTVAGLPAAGVQLADRTLATGRYVADEPGQAPDVGVTAAALVGSSASRTVAGVADAPVRGSVRLGGEIAAGTAIARGARRGVSAARSAPERVRAQTREFVSDERGMARLTGGSRGADSGGGRTGRLRLREMASDTRGQQQISGGRQRRRDQRDDPDTITADDLADPNTLRREVTEREYGEYELGPGQPTRLEGMTPDMGGGSRSIPPAGAPQSPGVRTGGAGGTGLELLSQAQQPQARVDDEVSGQQEDLAASTVADLDDATATTVADVAAESESLREQAQQQEATVEDVGQTPSARSRTGQSTGQSPRAAQTPRLAQRPVEDTRPVDAATEVPALTAAATGTGVRTTTPPPRRIPFPDPDPTPAGSTMVAEDDSPQQRPDAEAADPQISWYAEQVEATAGREAESPGADVLGDLSSGIRGAEQLPSRTLLEDDETSRQIRGFFDPSVRARGGDSSSSDDSDDGDGWEFDLGVGL